ncbi:MAG: hypothetical protein ACQESR_04765 [Planctomycetota bacterium]
MESCPTQAVLPLVGLAADNVIRDRYLSLSVESWNLNGFRWMVEEGGLWGVRRVINRWELAAILGVRCLSLLSHGDARLADVSPFHPGH